jgi:O-antigen ligase
MYRLTKILQIEPWRKQLLFVTMLAMLVALFLSRSALSISMIVFVSTSLLHARIKDQLLFFIRSPLLWGMSLLFFLPLISGLWSEDRSSWLRIMVIKAPLFFMPLAFARPFGFSQKQWKWIAWLMITCVTAAAAWSLFHYIQNYSAVNEGYLRAKSLLTVLDNDRVRFSWLIAVSIFLCGMIMRQKNANKTEKMIVVSLGIGLIVFLHVLSVRTGLISFYLLGFALFVWLITRQKIKSGVFLIAAICVLPIAAYFIFPSFQNRVKYFRYEFSYFKKAAYLPGGNDVTRVISLKAGWDIMNAHPVTGTGLGDLDVETGKWYDSNYPELIKTDRIAPGSEWLIYGSVNGWPGFLVFTFVMLLPFFISERKHLSWIMLSIITAFSFLFDIGLEVQFGVFIYTFVVLSWWKWMVEKEHELNNI